MTMRKLNGAAAAAALLVGIAAAGTPAEARIVLNGITMQGMNLQGVNLRDLGRAGAAGTRGRRADFDFTAVELRGVALPDQRRAPQAKHEEAAE